VLWRMFFHKTPIVEDGEAPGASSLSVGYCELRENNSKVRFEIFLNVKTHSLFVEDSRGFRPSRRCEPRIRMTQTRTNNNPDTAPKGHRTNRKAPTDKSHSIHFPTSLRPFPLSTTRNRKR
jgi:hypothetical protein